MPKLITLTGPELRAAIDLARDELEVERELFGGRTIAGVEQLLSGLAQEQVRLRLLNYPVRLNAPEADALRFVIDLADPNAERVELDSLRAKLRRRTRSPYPALNARTADTTAAKVPLRWRILPGL